MNSRTDTNLEYHWIASGIASSLSRFIPVPLVDGILETSAKRYSIDRTLKSHNRKFSAKDLSPLYQDHTSVSGVFVGKLKQLALYPVRKITKLVSASKGLPKDFAETYFLARALDICLDKGMFSDSENAESRREEAEKVRRAFDVAFGQIDDRLLISIAEAVRGQFYEMKPEVKAALTNIMGRSSSLFNTKAKRETKENEEAPARAQGELRKDAGFAALVSKFDENFARELKS